MMTESLLAVGVDGARGGWLAASAFGVGEEISRVTLTLLQRLEELELLKQDTDVPIAVDVPMGLLTSVDYRPCDREARRLLGARGSSVFLPPSRPLLAVASYAEARQLVDAERVNAPQAKSLSAQAFGIAPKVREADQYLRSTPHAQDWLWECHPELSFQGLAGTGLPAKTSIAGQTTRLNLLNQRFPALLATLGTFTAGGKLAKLDDALDAFACLHTALAVVTGTTAFLLGGDTDVDDEGLKMRIVG